MRSRAVAVVAGVLLLEVATAQASAHQDYSAAPNGASPWHYSESWVMTNWKVGAGSPVVHQQWTLRSGSVLFEVRLDHPLPAALFGQLGSVVDQVEAPGSRLEELMGPGGAGA